METVCVCGLKNRGGSFNQYNCYRLISDDFRCYNCHAHAWKYKDAPSFLNKLQYNIQVHYKGLEAHSITTNDVLSENNVFGADANDQLKFPNTITEIWRLSDNDFYKFFHMSRKSVLALIELVENVSFTLSSNSKNERLKQTLKKVNSASKDCIVLVCLWYLVNPNSTSTEGTLLFSLNNEKEFEYILDRGFSLIARLEDSIIKWPTKNELKHIVTTIGISVDIGNCVGALGVRTYSLTNYRNIHLLAICDGNSMFTAVHVKYNVSPLEALVFSDLHNKVKSLPDNYFVTAVEDTLIGPHDLLGQVSERFHKPERGGSYAQQFETLYPILTCFQEIEARFPRLPHLDRFIPNVLLSATIIHNVCVINKDIPTESLLAERMYM